MYGLRYLLDIFYPTLHIHRNVPVIVHSKYISFSKFHSAIIYYNIFINTNSIPFPLSLALSLSHHYHILIKNVKRSRPAGQSSQEGVSMPTNADAAAETSTRIVAVPVSNLPQQHQTPATETSPAD